MRLLLKHNRKSFQRSWIFPLPILLTYPRETAIAEKFEAIVNLGLTNSRMKDYYDIWLLSQQFDFDGELSASHRCYLQAAPHFIAN